MCRPWCRPPGLSRPQRLPTSDGQRSSHKERRRSASLYNLEELRAMPWLCHTLATLCHAACLCTAEGAGRGVSSTSSLIHCRLAQRSMHNKRRTYRSSLTSLTRLKNLTKQFAIQCCNFISKQFCLLYERLQTKLLCNTMLPFSLLLLCTVLAMGVGQFGLLAARFVCEQPKTVHESIHN